MCRYTRDSVIEQHRHVIPSPSSYLTVPSYEDINGLQQGNSTCMDSQYCIRVLAAFALQR